MQHRTEDTAEKAAPLKSSKESSQDEGRAVPGQTLHGDVPVFDHVQERRIMRKLDLRLVPMVTILYFLSFLDRGNIGNARVLGMEKSLKLVGNQYSLALMVFFFPYALLEVPANLLLKRLRPSIWLPSIMVAWGAVTIGIGFVKNFDHLVICRVFLGVAEAGQYPGCVFYLTTFYRREDLAFRQGVFFSAASIAGAFSGLLAYGISHMDGVAGLEGWQWIFILEGLLTCVVGLLAYLWITDSPESAKFLTPAERDWVIDRLKHRTSSGRLISESQKFSWKMVLEGAMNVQVLLGIVIAWAGSTSIYGMSYFMPSIVNRLGYTGQQANLLTIPAYVCASFLTVALCWLSDRMKNRSVFLLCLFTGQVIGYIMSISGSAAGGVPGVVYAGCFITVSCCYPALVLTVSWIIPNIAPQYKRAVGSGMLIGVGNLAGVFASNWYRAQDAPKYLLGHGMEIMITVIGFICVNVLRWWYKRINRQRDAVAASVAEQSEEELALAGDLAPSFRYGL